MSAETSQPRLLDWVIFLLAPLCFATNIIFDRGVIGEVAPFTTAFIRWTASALFIACLLYTLEPAADLLCVGVWGAWFII